MKKRKRAVTLLMSLVMLLGLLTAGASAADLPFTDVATGDWFYPGVSFAYEAGLMNGVSSTSFDPNGNTTRGMFVTMLYRMAGSPFVFGTGVAGEGPAITDVRDGDYYYSPVRWAMANDIVSGYDDSTFRPNNPVTRQEMAVFLYRYARLKGQDMSAREDLSKFSDASSVSSWADEEMSWAVANKLISGLTDTVLGPGGNASRAQVATIFMRFDSLVNGTPIEPVTDTVVKVEFKKLSGISATVTGYGKDGGTVWTYNTPSLEDLMLDRVDDIGQKGDAYYFVEDGSVVALDVQTGKELWRNGDFKGYGSISAMGDAIYLCGYFGPDFYAVSYDGKTLARNEQFHKDYMWPFKIELSGNCAIVHMSSGPNGDGIDQPFHVDLTNYTVKMG